MIAQTGDDAARDGSGRLRSAVTMATQLTPPASPPLAPPTPSRPLRRRAELRASAAAAGAMLLIVVALAVADPSGLLAPVGGRGVPLVGAGDAYRWAPLVLGLPILLAGVAVPVLVVARVGRPAVTGRRVFGVAWLASVGAATLAAALSGLVAALPMVGAHLDLGAAVRFAFSTAGFAGMKFLLAGPLVGLAAFLGFRFAPRAAAVDGSAGAGAPRAVGLPIALMAVVVPLAAVGFAATSWRGGPVGYAFSGPLVAPTAGAGALGTLAGMLVFVGIFAAIVRAGGPRMTDEPGAVSVAVWLAAVLAGLGLGVVDAVVAALPGSAHLDDAGPDSWWIATTFLSVATGIGYGVSVGLLAAVLTGVAWRWRDRLPHPPHPRSTRRVAVGLGVVLLAVPLVIGPPAAVGPQESEPAAATGDLERLQVLPASAPGGLPVIGDATGRQVILRGVNVNQLIDYYLRDPAVPATGPLTDDDFAQIASMGFDVVRLGMSWSRLEPTRGELDRAYLGQIKEAVASAKAHGIYTVLDMHGDAWGNALAKPDQQCDGGTEPTKGWDGAPAWATITDGALHCQFMARDLAPAVATAYTNFYTDRDGIQTELLRSWAAVVREFADESAVAGYDLLNEPGIGANPPIGSGLLLGRYYDAAISAIRAAEADAGGFPHLVFFEPSVLWSGLAFDVTPPPGFTDDRQLVFAPHPYSESISMDQSFGLTIASIERNLAVSAEAAASYGAALWAGEWGWFGDPDVDGTNVERMLDAQDRLGIGGAFWVWRQGCGSPETGADAETSGNLVSVDCATGELSPPPAGFAEPLSRAYARAIPGRLDAMRSSGRGLQLAGTVDDGAVNCQVDLWVPGEAQPELSTESVTDVEAEKVEGGWRVSGCAEGSYGLAVTS